MEQKNNNEKKLIEPTSAAIAAKPLLAAVLKNSLLIFGVFILIVGNELCYYCNNLPLKPLTDIVAVFIITINFRKR